MNSCGSLTRLLQDIGGTVDANHDGVESLLNSKYDLVIINVEDINLLNKNIIKEVSSLDTSLKIILTNDKSNYKCPEDIDTVILTPKNLDDCMNGLIWTMFASCHLSMYGLDFADIRTVLLCSKFGVLNMYHIDKNFYLKKLEAAESSVSGAFNCITILPSDALNDYVPLYHQRIESICKPNAVNIFGCIMQERLPDVFEGNVFEILMIN